MTKKAEKLDLDNLINTINHSSEFFILAKEAGYLVVGTVMNLKVRIEKSGNIFQPFGKNIDKYLPIYFPVIFDMKKAKSSDIVYGFNEFEIPLLHLNARQIKMDRLNIEAILYKYIDENFKK
jgi:hypothetical protein